jgi:hypothetical protein
MTTQYVVRLAPVTNSPVIVDANSLNAGRLKAWVDNSDVEIGIDYFRASTPVEIDYAHKIVKEFAKQHNIPEHDVLVRARLPKTNVKPRKTNDTDLVLVKGEQKDDLQQAAQSLQDEHDKGKKATASDPEGATVKRSGEEKRTKRAYNRTPKAERSAKSKSAFERYQRDLAAAAAKSETLMQPVAPQVAKEVYEKAVQDLATKLAKLLLDNSGVL